MCVLCLELVVCFDCDLLCGVVWFAVFVSCWGLCVCVLLDVFVCVVCDCLCHFV